MKIMNVLEETMITLADMKNKMQSVFNGFCDFLNVKCMFYKNPFLSSVLKSQLSHYYSTLVPFADLMSKSLVACCKFCFLMLI